MWALSKRFIKDYIFKRKKKRRKFLLVQFMHMIAVALLLVPPILVRNIVDEAIPQSNVRLLMIYAGAMVAISAVWCGIAAAKEYWGHEVAQRVTARMRNDLYDHFQKLSMTFHDNKKTGELLSRIVDDINVIEEFVHHGPETFILAIMMVSGSLGILFWLHWQLALIAAAFLPLLLLFARKTGGQLLREFREERKRKASLSDILEENLSGMHIIKAFVREQRQAREVAEANEEHYHSRMRVIKWVAMMFPGSMLLKNTAVACILLFGGMLVVRHGMEIGVLVAFLMYMEGLLRPIIQLMFMLERSGQFFAGVERFYEYMDIEPDIRTAEPGIELPKVHGRIVFDNVHFKYDRDQVLEDIDFTAEPGQMVALVGPSGAGKTTITRLIPRFYEPYKGRILLDGHDVHEYRLAELRSHIGIVMQDDFLFSTTVAENIRYGKPEATIEEVIDAAQRANASPFIEEMSDGYDTEIGKRGIKLSEGQRQRVSIARAILKNPQILLLDEATSSVDSETEMLIQRAIENLRKGRTTFVIAHRLSTILEADQILFIQGGRIVERGTHQELMKLDGNYARFYRIQFGVTEAV